jgi:hypothetical protein
LISAQRQINIWGATKVNFEYGRFYLNLYVQNSEYFDNENHSYLHPELAC